MGWLERQKYCLIKFCFKFFSLALPFEKADL